MIKFLKSKTKVDLPREPTVYPPGTFVESEKGYFFILNSFKRYRLISKRVLDSWSPHRVVKTTEAALKGYRVAAKMKFRNGSLIHSLADGRIYLIVEGKRCPVVSPDVFDRLGVKPDASCVVSVSADEIKLHELGEEIS